MLESMKQRVKALIILCNENPISLTSAQVAEFLGTTKDVLLDSAIQGRCQFAIGKQNVGGNRFAVIPTLAFYNWFMKGTVIEESSLKSLVEEKERSKTA